MIVFPAQIGPSAFELIGIPDQFSDFWASFPRWWLNLSYFNFYGYDGVTLYLSILVPYNSNFSVLFVAFCHITIKEGTTEQNRWICQNIINFFKTKMGFIKVFFSEAMYKPKLKSLLENKYRCFSYLVIVSFFFRKCLELKSFI